MIINGEVVYITSMEEFENREICSERLLMGTGLSRAEYQDETEYKERMRQLDKLNLKRLQQREAALLRREKKQM